MLKVKIEDFLKTAKLGFIETGLSRSRLIELLGKPEWEIPTLVKYPIYQYGCVEIGFEDLGRLTAVSIKFPYRGRKSSKINDVLEIEDFMKVKRMNIKKFERFLSKNNIKYNIDEIGCDEIYHSFVLPNNIGIVFEKEPEKINTIGFMFYFPDSILHYN